MVSGIRCFYDFALGYKDDIFGNIGREIGYALQVTDHLEYHQCRPQRLGLWIDPS